MTAPVGLFGLGLIGNALAGRLHAAGFTVIGHDPDPARMEGFVGTPLAPAEIWDRAETILIAVFDTSQVEAVLASAPPACTACVIITSTCNPDSIAALPDRCPPGLRLVEAPISGTSVEVAAGTAVFLLGGEDEALSRAAPVLSQLGRAAHAMGPLGNGSRTKLVLNLILGLNRAALAEGLALAEMLGLAPDSILRVAQDSAAASAVMATKGPLMVADDFRPQGRVTQSAKDFGLILQLAGAAGRDLPFARTYLDQMQDCIAAGEGDLDNAAIILAIRRAVGRSNPPSPHRQNMG